MWLFAAFLACESGESSSPAPAVSEAPAPGLGPEQLASIAKELQASPDRVDEVLAPHGLDEEGFVAALEAVAAEPEASKAYEAALSR